MELQKLLLALLVVMLGVQVYNLYKVIDTQSYVDELQKRVAITEREVEELRHKVETYSHSLLDTIATLEEELAVAQAKEQKLAQEVRIASMTESGEWHTYKATFYSNGFKSTGKNPGDKAYGITYSGHRTQAALTAAVDPNVIPLGSWFVVKFPDGTMETYRADDIGSGVRGRHVDIFVPTDKVADNSGTIEVEVKILE